MEATAEISMGKRLYWGTGALYKRQGRHTQHQGATGEGSLKATLMRFKFRAWT